MLNFYQKVIYNKKNTDVEATRLFIPVLKMLQQAPIISIII